MEYYKGLKKGIKMCLQLLLSSAFETKTKEEIIECIDLITETLSVSINEINKERLNKVK